MYVIERGPALPDRAACTILLAAQDTYLTRVGADRCVKLIIQNTIFLRNFTCRSWAVR